MLLVKTAKASPTQNFLQVVGHCSISQRWSPRGRPWPRGRPRGQILKSLALALKVNSLALASRPQVLENWPVLGSRTAVFFELLKFCGALEKFFGKHFFMKIAWKIFVKTFFFFFFLEIAWKIFVKTFYFFFFWRALALVSLVLGLGLEHSCPWPREVLSSERLSLALASDFFCVLGLGLGLESCVLDSTSGISRTLVSAKEIPPGPASHQLKIRDSATIIVIMSCSSFKRGLHEKSLAF